MSVGTHLPAAIQEVQSSVLTNPAPAPPQQSFATGPLLAYSVEELGIFLACL